MISLRRLTVFKFSTFNQSHTIPQILTAFNQQLTNTIQPIKPIITDITHNLINFQTSTNMPWWSIMLLSCFAMRATIFPLYKLNRKSLSYFPIFPTLKYIILSFFSSPTDIIKNLRFGIKSLKDLSERQSKSTPLFIVHKMVNYPLIGLGLCTLNEIIQRGLFNQMEFAYISDLSKFDPLFILPTLITIINFVNCSRFIRKDNKTQLITKVRMICRASSVFVFPILCCFPSAINLFLLTNSLLIFLQNRITSPKRGLYVLKIFLKILSISTILLIVILYILQATLIFYLESKQ